MIKIKHISPHVVLTRIMITSWLKTHTQPLSNPPRLSLLAGLLYGLAFYPWIIAPFFIIALYLYAYTLYQSKNVREASWTVMLFSCGYVASSLFWIGYAFVNIQQTLIAIPALLAMAFVFAAIAWPFLLPAYLVKQQRLSQLIIFAVGFSVQEWIRSHCFSGLPWNLAGHTWGMMDMHTLSTTIPAALPALGLIMQQNVVYCGIHGLSLLTVILALTSVYGVRRRGRGQGAAIVIALAILCTLSGYGYLRLSVVTPHSRQIATIIRLVQPCIDPNAKWDMDFLHQTLQRYLELSQQSSLSSVNAIVWPEAALPIRINDEPQLRAELAQHLLTHPNRYLLTGAVSTVHSGAKKDTQKLFSVLAAISAQGAMPAVYAKSHLVPFGEFNPFAFLTWLPLQKLTPGMRDYSPGTGLQIMHLPSLPPFMPLI